MDGTETAADLKEGEEDAKVVYPRDAAQEDEAADGAVEGPTMSTSSQQNEEEAAADSDRCHTAEVPSVEDGLRESPLGDVASIGGTKEPAAPESHEPVAIPVEDGEQDAAKVASPPVEEPQPACVAREEEQDAKESQEPALAAPGLEDRCPTSPEGAGVLLSIDSHDGTQVISPIVEEPSMEDEETVILETGDCQLPEPANGPELSEPVLDSEPKEHPLPSETILVPGSPQGSPAAGTRSGIPDAVFHQVPLMPPGSFFDPTALQQWTEKARAEYSELLSWLMSPLGCDDAERLLQEHQEQEEEEADCQALVLRVARRHMWRERSKRMKLRPTRPIRSKVPSELFALAKMEDEASLLVKGIEKRQSELAAAIKQQQEVRGEIAVWNKRVTDLEMQHVQARAVDEHRGNLSTQVPMMRAESMPVLGKAQAFHPQMPQVPWVPPWAQTSWTPQLPPASVHVPHAPHTVGQVHAGAQPAAVGLQTGSPQKVLMSPHLASPHLASPHLASPHLASPQAPQGPMPLQQQVLSSPGRQVGGLTSPGGLGSPPTRIVSWSSPRSPLSPSPGSSLLPVRQPGSHLVPSGSLRLPPQVPGANMVRMVNSYSAGQLPKAGSFLTPAAAPNLQVQSLAATMPGTHPVSSCPSFRPVETEGAPQVSRS